jgi:primosomal protein N'
MKSYNILPTKNIGHNLSVLTYSSSEELQTGQAVEILIRNSLDTGLVLGESLNNNFDENKVKEIEKILPIKLSSSQILFLKLFNDNTFNSLNDTWEAVYKPYTLLTKKQHKELDEINKNDKQDILLENITNKKETIEFELNFDYVIRIMNLIRSIIDKTQNAQNADKIEINKQIIIVFPERKLLYKIHELIQVEITKNKELNSLTNLWIYFGGKDKNCKSTVWNLVKKQFSENNLNYVGPKKNQNYHNCNFDIIFTTRAGIFLPFTNLDTIIFVDEANSMYIQEQNSLYYDTREAIFLLNKAFLSSLIFVSPLPSVRLYDFYSKANQNEFLTKYSQETSKPLNIEITRYDKKSAKFNLFSWQVEQILKPDEENSG